MMNRSVFGLAFAGLLFALRFCAEAQHPNKVPRIANHSRIDSATDTRSERFGSPRASLALPKERTLQP